MIDTLLVFYYNSLDAVVDFGERGGPIINYIGIVIFFMWFLVFERFWYYSVGYRALHRDLIEEWSQRTELVSWYAQNIRADLLSQGKMEINRNISLIESCFMLCPLLGLLGTVTGMIDVFQVLAVTGGGDAKPMAGGVSRATLPTLSGMVGALSGYIALLFVRAQARRRERILEFNLPSS
ncbi:MAG: MotA/TolQ/ExbB proton channel family protein [Gammaproteobacteria bacterium]